MTIAVVWVRTLTSGAEELVFCSDSRLSGGKRFDQAQKIFRFARTDAAICFAGGTFWAYPMVVAAVKAAGVHIPSTTRAIGLSKFKSHVVALLNQMQAEVHTYADGENIPDVAFIMGGYDWSAKRFRIWRIEFDKEEMIFISSERKGSNRYGSLGKLEMAGDDEWIEELRRRLKMLAQERYGLDMKKPPGSKFNLEPFEVVRDLLREADPAHTIGGAPQIVKIYQYLNSVNVGVFWPDLAEGRLFLSGRPLLDYENASIQSVLDPDTLQSTWARGSSKEAANSLINANTIQAGFEGPEADIASM